MVIRLVNNWMLSHGLTLAIRKTDFIVLTKKRIPTIIAVCVGDEVVELKPAAKYLGVMIDSKLSFFEQTKLTVDKAAKGLMRFSRLMANIDGPKTAVTFDGSCLVSPIVWSRGTGRLCES